MVPKSVKTAKLKRLFKDYASYHITFGNQLTHYFGIPMILISLLGLLSGWVILPEIGSLPTLFRLDGGVILLKVGILIYLFLDFKLGVAFAFILSGFYFLGRALPPSVSWGLFILGWILQGLGHWVFEKKRPAFLENLMHLFIGPFWIFAKLVGYRI